MAPNLPLRWDSANNYMLNGQWIRLPAEFIGISMQVQVQFILGTMSVFQFPPVDNHATPIVTSLSNLHHDRVIGQYSAL